MSCDQAEVGGGGYGSQTEGKAAADLGEDHRTVSSQAKEIGRTLSS